MKYNYILPFGIYVLTIPILTFFFKVDKQIAYAINAFLVLGPLIYYWKSYRIKAKWDIYSIFTGALIFCIWIGFENFYPHFYDIEFKPYDEIFLCLKLFGFILVAPLIEEIFTRGFLIRLIQNNDYEKVPIGKFTWASFIVTVLFFGLAHNRWLVGIITGIILNMLYYRNKNVFSSVVAHYTANLLLAIYIVSFGLWQLW